MRRFSDRHTMSTLTEINVTPLLDLAFVLLIIFIITTPLLENSVDLVVPTSSTAKGDVDPSKVQMIEMDKNNVIKLEEDEVDLASLETRLRSLREADEAVAVVVRPHNALPIQRFVAVMDAVQRAGITKVGVMTRREDPK